MAEAEERKATYKLAVLRCDTHAYWYGALYQRPEPLLFRQHNHVCHHYFTDIYDPTKWTVPFVNGFQIARCWDYERDRAERFATTFGGTGTVCETVAEATEGVDAAFIADCNDDGSDHLKLARPFLEKRIPLFIDKPFAGTLADAQAIVKLAVEYETPLYSASLLSWIPAMKQFRRRFEEIDPVGLVVAKGVGAGLAGIIHGVALAQGLMNRVHKAKPSRAAVWVECMGELPLEILRVHYADGREALILNTSVDVFPRSCAFYAAAYSKVGALHSGPFSDFEFMAGGERILKRFRKMLRTSRPPVPYDALLEKIAIVEAGRLAQSEHRRVEIGEVWPGEEGE